MASVGTPAAAGRATRSQAGPYGWDWSSTTHSALDEHGNPDVRRVGADLLDALGGMHHLPGKGMQGWTRSVESFDCDGYKLGAVYLGGRDDVHVVSTSAAADWTRPAVVRLHGARTARVDTRVDTLASFDELAALCEDAAETYNSVVTTMESRRAGKSEGRTVYLGSPRSMVRVRVYEKWLESPGQYVEGTNRVEVQLRPVSQMKRRASELTAVETFCATKTTRDLAASLGGQVADAGSLRVRRGTPDLERSLAAMGTQYRKVVDRHLARSGGDFGRVLDYLTGQVSAAV